MRSTSRIRTLDDLSKARRSAAFESASAGSSMSGFLPPAPLPGLRRRPRLNATPIVVAAVPLVTDYIRLLRGNEVRKVTPLFGLRDTGPSRFPGAYDV
jgi:hypothetical protein